MTEARPLRIAILAHSTNPRGGVVHALALGDALVRLGHEAVVHAPDAKGAGFFRPTICRTVQVPASEVDADTAAVVDTRVADYVRHFEKARNRDFDVFHAQDGISGNALATLKERGLITRFTRTVHHVDAFEDPRLTALQTRAIMAADQLFVVSRTWRGHLRDRFGKPATVVGNGVDRSTYTSIPDGREPDLRRRLGLGAGPVFLAIGGVEERKNTIGILQAFLQLRIVYPRAQLVVAGGASLLDHHTYQARFDDALAEGRLPEGSAILTGPVAHDDMPALYRICNTLVFPSLREGFGLVVIEAMASGVPVIVARVEPFTEYLGDDEAIWCDPRNAASIANAMVASLGEPFRSQLAKRGANVAARHDWLDTARAHLPAYQSLRELQHA
jgi:glycosyltransferase-like protein